MKNSIRQFLFFLAAPATLVCAFWLKLLRQKGSSQLSDSILMLIGVLPIVDHYYEPMINPKKYLERPLHDDRILEAIDLNVEGQLDLLQKFTYCEELNQFPVLKGNRTNQYYYLNDSYGPGDGEYLYNMIRCFQPKQFIEVGSGNSTLMAINAIKKNQQIDPNYYCKHICLEPFEQPWLEELGVSVRREKVEKINIGIFKNLEANDILFIDSSHIIRPQGDVLHEYLTILPLLKPGVIIHIHDIFTPKDYPEKWIIENHRFWNEQYILEAFLSFNRSFEIIGALNYLKHNHFEELKAACPILKDFSACEPGAFWMKKLA
jgi:predicted O-methyltransferase YrrM